ncbi:MAG: BREX-4 system phosphatase PglZ [Firmicutes bacterium]|nr:BREX-4 system phosphatase PglZ [Bacillota bacterium]
MRIDLVKQYLASSDKTPYFLFINDGQYKKAMDELAALGLAIVQTSSFCNSEDKKPDIDKLLTHIKMSDASAKGKGLVVTGLGEYLALCGNDEANKILLRLKNYNLGAAKVVLLLRGLATQIDKLRADLRFDGRMYSVVERAECDLTVTLVAPSIGLPALVGFKALLKELEAGKCGNIVASTFVNLEKSLFTLYHINNAYEGIKYFSKNFALPCSCGNDVQWANLLTELNQSNGSLDKVFEKYDFRDTLDSSFYGQISGGEYRNWLYFVFLKSKAEFVHNKYLRFVLNKTNHFDDFACNVLDAIIEIPHTDENFSTFYQERKVLIEKFPEPEIANFVVNNRRIPSESIYKLTDGTRVEREEIIAWLSKYRLVPEPEIKDIYPLLADYMKKYVFKCPELAELLTNYFEAYKRQKLFNVLESEFLAKVDELAHSRKFNQLPTRNVILDDVDRSDTFLYWLDAFGVEYLGLIEALVEKLGLSIKVNIVRAELPTITDFNKDFFIDWEGHKEKNDELDHTKHNDKGGYNFINNELPIHLAKELDIIAEMINKAATELALRHYKRFLIVSDHGASRLAVLRRKEEKYDTGTTGERSGRCCKLFHPYDLPFAAEENGYLVLADYGRFKGGRAANVEVHGGASLEEVVVPVIELSLKNSDITVKLVDDFVTVDFRTGAEIKLFFNSFVEDVSIILNGKQYLATQTDTNHYTVKIPDLKRAGNYPADVYIGDNLVGKITIIAQGKSGRINDDFDDLF